MTITDGRLVLPLTPIVSSELTELSSGELTVKENSAVGVGVVPFWGREVDSTAGFFKAWLAVQIPKVITSPREKPIMIAMRTSFLIVNEAGYFQTITQILCGCQAIMPMIKLLTMEVKYFGHSCFLLRGKTLTLLTDPYSPEIGFKLPSVGADVVTVSHAHYDHNYTKGVESKEREEVFIVNGPGEYEIGGASILGLATYHDSSQGTKRGKNTVYLIEMEGIRLAHLGDLGHSLTDDQREELNGIDVLLVPVGGTYTLGPKQAAGLVSQVEPSIVIPMHYRLPGLKIDLAPVDDFLKELGVRDSKPLEKLTISQDRLPEEREVVVLNAKR